MVLLIQKNSFCIAWWGKITQQLTEWGAELWVFRDVRTPQTEERLTYFSPAPGAPPRTRSCVAAPGLRGPGGGAAVPGALPVLVLAHHGSALEPRAAAARALPGETRRTQAEHRAMARPDRHRDLDSNSRPPLQNLPHWNHNLNWEKSAKRLKLSASSELADEKVRL